MKGDMLAEEAADRIEELTLQLLAAKGQAADNLERADQAEAMLKEAVEALRQIMSDESDLQNFEKEASGDDNCNNYYAARYWSVQLKLKWRMELARATLARITQEGKE